MVGCALAVSAAGQPGAIVQAKVIAGLQRDVVGQAGVSERAVIFRVREAREQRIDVGCVRVVRERAPVGVLHHHDPHGLDRPNAGKTAEAIKTAREVRRVGLDEGGLGDAVGGQRGPVGQIAGGLDYVARAGRVRNVQMKRAVGVLGRIEPGLRVIRLACCAKANQTDQQLDAEGFRF